MMHAVLTDSEKGYIYEENDSANSYSFAHYSCR